MVKIGKETFSSPLGIFIIYILGAALVIMGFRFIFPGEAAPLACFSSSWRLIRGFLDYLGLFPALVLSALVIPFGFRIYAQEKIKPFSPQFLQSLRMSIITVIVAGTLYGLLFSLALPLAQDFEENLRFQGRLYQLARERAQEHAANEEWAEAAQFTAVCERIWPNGPEISKLKTEVDIRSEEVRLSHGSEDNNTGTAFRPSLPGPQAVNATEALTMAETALAEERYFDAHWLATLAGHLARPGSVETAEAARLAGRAWDGVNSLAPSAREAKAYNTFRLKKEGYEALVAQEWIRSYYIFRELAGISPEDPDAAKYLALSEQGLGQTAFFIDEMELSLGEILTGAVFSLPLGPGRLVMRISSLSTSPDSAYGMGIEMMAFDRDGRPLWSMEAPYAKILPLTLDSGPAVAVLMRALDRTDQSKQWEPVKQGMGQSAPDGAQMILEVSWDNFLLLSNVNRGLSGLSPADLKRAAEYLGSYGYQSEVFEAELLRRFAEPLLLLPLGVFAIVIGWRYRAVKRPRYMGIPMLGILPLVFYGTVHLCRGWINNMGIWAVLSLGFTTAAVFFAAAFTLLLILSLIILAAQHG